MMHEQLFNQMSVYWMDGAVRFLEGVRRGLSPVFLVDEDPEPITPFRVVFESGKARLRYYQGQGARKATPLVISYALFKRPFIMDLIPGRSLIGNLNSQGFDVYLIDWMPPAAEDAWRGFDSYVNRDLDACVRFACSHSGAEKVSLMGYCSGGLLTTVYAALHPTRVRNLLALAMPVDMTKAEVALFRMMERVSAKTLEMVADVYGNCPAWMVNQFFTALSPVHHAVDKYVSLYRNQEREDYAGMFDRFERWMNADVPLAGQIYREITRDLFQNNLLVKNRLKVGSRTVDLRNITMPVLNIYGKFDDVVPSGASLGFTELVASEDKETFSYPAGHVGLVVSSGAHQKLWPQVGQWLMQRDQ